MQQPLNTLSMTTAKEKQNENRWKREEKLPQKQPKLKETLAALQKQHKNTKEKGVNSHFRACNVIHSG